MNLRKSLCVSLFFALLFVSFSVNVFSQARPRVVESRQNLPDETRQNDSTQKLSKPTSQRPTLTNNITVQNSPSLVKKTGSSQPVGAVPNSYVSKNAYTSMFNQKLLFAIQNRIGIPYHYGSEGPNSYDCSGLVWSVFGEAGFYFDRTSARTIWENSESVEGADRYKFGTLVFFNSLGHIGIVADENGFYHASLSHGVTYSKFEGYWEKRIVGFRRLSVTK